ncbi:hypothetical protein ABH935_006194 [Catenulispora sp. GAS73]|uniref:hypothetical protein n=1 Tax=Catenulispora sp. GAS73 TaxID=3156269 RepID=UPI0035147762
MSDKQEADERFERERVEAERRLTEERAAANERLLEEREIAERRVVEEREFATAERLHERQAGRAAVLLGYVALLRRNLPLIEERNAREAPSPTWVTLEEVARELVSGAHVDAPMLGNAEVEERYRTLVHLFLSVRQKDCEVTPGKTVGDLRNYAKFVKLSLIALVEGTELPKNEGQKHPHLASSGDRAQWHPSHIPPDFDDEATLDPHDPQFRPLP